VELRFIETHVVGATSRQRPTFRRRSPPVETAAAGIRARRFEATPSRQACRYCAYNQICAFTATRE
jgi:hypothetical protein